MVYNFIIIFISSLFILIIFYIYFIQYSKLIIAFKSIEKINGKYFSTESLCGSFLNDVLYDINKDNCQLPCNITNNFHLISSQKFAYCSRLPDFISINGDMINARFDITIRQHKVSNKLYYKKQQSLKV